MPNLRNNAQEIIRSSGKIFGLDLIYFFKGGSWTSLSFVISSLASIATMVALGNLLSREAYGTYNYLLSLGASLSFLTLTGAGIAVMRAVARGQENIVPVAFKLQLKYNSLASLVIIAAAFYYGYNGNFLFAYSLFLLVFVYPIGEVLHIYKQVLIGKKRFDILTKISSFTTLFGTVSTIIALFLTQNILILIGVFSATSFISNIAAYLFTTRRLDKTHPTPESVNEMKRTSFHITGAGIIGVISSYIDKIILFQLAGPAVLAVYGFAIAGPERLKSLIKNWAGVAVPGLAQRSLKEIRSALYKRIAFSIIAGSSLFLLYFLVAPFLFKLLLPRYLDAIPYSQVYAVSLVIAPISIYIGGIFASQNMIRATYILNAGNQVFRIVLFAVLCWYWQIWGLIIASVLSTLINAVYGIFVWEREYRRLLKKNG